MSNDCEGGHPRAIRDVESSSSVRLSAHGCLGLSPCFACLDAFVPRVIQIGVTSTLAVSEPRTTATATTTFARFHDGATF